MQREFSSTVTNVGSKKSPVYNSSVSSRSFSKGRITTHKSNSTRLNGSITESSSSSSYNILNLIFVLFLFIVVGRMFSTGNITDIISFKSFLEFLQTVPTFELPFTSFQEHMLVLPEFLFWLQYFLNFFGGIYNVAIFLFNGLIQVVQFFVWFLGWIFV